MKLSVPLLLSLAVLTGSGCSSHRHQPAAAAKGQAGGASRAIVTPASSLAGSVVSYNAVGRFVVIGFTAGHVPPVGQSLFLYRNGLKTAEIKITGPQRDNYTVADVVTGDAQAGDGVREQ